MSIYAKPISIKSARRNYSDEEKKKFKVDLKKMYEEEKRPVKGRFICLEPRGGSLSFMFFKYEWDQPTQYSFVDGGEYEIPLSVARHLNGIDITAKSLNGQTHTCSYAVNQWKIDEMGNSSIDVGKRKRRFAFQTFTGETLG